MKIVFLDAYTMNPGDLDFTALYQLGDFKKYDRSKLDDIPEEVREAEILIVNKFEINERSLSLMPKVKYICVAATGFNNIDIDAVRNRNILVSNVKDYSTESVAQHVMASILAFYNRVEYYNQRVKEGEWSKKEDFCFYEKTIYPLSSQTIGIIGYGSIGKRVTRLADSFGMRVLVNTRSDISDKTNVVQVDRDTLYNESDIITLHLPLKDDTKYMINKNSLLKMKPNTLLINTSRGPLVNADDLLEAMENNIIAGAVLDVLEVEPPKNPHPVIFHNHCMVTPHIAWAGLGARQKLLEGIVDNIANFIEGKWVNPVY